MSTALPIEAKKALRRELEAAGVFERTPLASLGLLLAMLAGLGATFAAAAALGGVAWFALIPVAAVFTTVAAMLGHEGGHRSFSSERWKNEALLTVTFPLLAGFSSAYWTYKHNILHHGHPNDVDLDPDVGLWPMTSNRRDHLRAGAARRWFQRHLQGWFFWPMTTLIHAAMRGAALGFMFDKWKRGPRSSLLVLDTVAIALHLVLWIALPATVYGLGWTLLFYAAFWSVVSFYLGTIFAPAHMGLALTDAATAEGADGWVLQLHTTRNIRLPRALSWMYVGLDYQIEHHLFPLMPHQHSAKAGPIVRAWAERHGLPYREVGFLEGYRDVKRFMDGAWDVEPEAPADPRGEPRAAPLALAAVSGPR